MSFFYHQNVVFLSFQMTKHKNKPLVPRDRPLRGGFSIPFKEIRDNAHAFVALMADAKERLDQEMSATPTNSEDWIVPAPNSILEVQMYSRAIQVFAAMAVEGALNTYGLMRFGEEQLKGYRGSTVRKLHDFLNHKYARPFGKEDPLPLALKRLADRRNAIVHIKADESVIDEQGQFTYVTPIHWPPATPKAAIDSMDEMELFFKEFPERDPETEMFFF